MKGRVSLSQLDCSALGGHNLFLLKFQEEVLLKQALGQIVDYHVPLSSREFNLFEISESGEQKAAPVISLCEEIPFFEGKRVVVLHGVEKFLDKEKKKLAAYLPELPSHSVLALAQKMGESKSRAAKKDEGGDFWDKAAGKTGLVVNCELDDKEFRQWVARRFKSADKEINTAALNLLVQKTGRDLNLLSQEIEKLILYAGDKPAVTPNMVEELVIAYPKVKIFALVDAVREKDTEKALKVLREIGKDTQAPGILAYLLAAFRGVLRRGQGFSGAEVHKFIEWFFRADMAVRAGKDQELIMETLLIQMCGRK